MNIPFRKADGPPIQVVPPSGATAHLVTATAFAMAVLAVVAIAATLAAHRLSARWSSELARSSTITILAPPETMQQQTAAALQAAQTTPGVLLARVLSEQEQQGLLAPWLGTDLALDLLPVPNVIVMEETLDGPDTMGLRLRLAGEAPDALYDDHTRWRRPMMAVAERLRLVGYGALGLITLCVAAMVTLAARAALSANRQVVETLRLIGARDSYIASAFVQRFAWRALVGAAMGSVLAGALIALSPDVARDAAFAAQLRPSGLEWLWIGLVPLIAGAVAYISTRIAAARMLANAAET
ncbi:cell division protein FtsX [Pontivivens insulae]|uniref:ABC3 transporter permease C-terminal domain-containing protein n=1 Tax=Pontivivens insulae TaxID=1639689 RepID=A0A2R8AD17_9RHOB|nr:FtsX-like permease family protein [Pontivivens insulae]RED13854.1 cell division transport system permease protein [Pontivivens insulae]SPF29928.1 hypothetical protein POI8812_02254 [Pontivivens insulae]